MQRENTFRILLIDQHPDDAHFISHYLEKAQLRGVADTTSVTHVESLSEGLDYLSEDTHDLVMVALDLLDNGDLETPGRDISLAHGVPVIVLAERDERETAINAIQNGAQDYLLKDSIDNDQLLRSIRYAVEQKARESELDHKRDELETLERVETLIREISTALVDASNRGEIGSVVCDCLVTAPAYESAVVGEFTTDTEQFVPQACGGGEKQELEEAIDAIDRLCEQNPLVTARRTREVQFVRDVAGQSGSVPETAKPLDGKFKSVIAVPLVFGSTVHGILALFVNRSDTISEQELKLFGELGEIIGLGLTAADRKEREQILTTLHHTTRQLLQLETKADVAELVVNTSRVVLDLSHVAIFCIDKEDTMLEPVAATSELAETGLDNSAVGPNASDSVVWDVFVSGDTTVIRDLEAAEPTLEMGEATDAQSGLFLPIGDRGVLVTLCSTVDAFDTHTRKIVGMLAATTEAAFERIDHEMDLRAHDQKLEERNVKLSQLNWINQIIRGIDQALIQASSREEVEEAVCEKLHKSDRFPFVWIGERDSTSGSVNPRAWVTEGSDYLDRVSFDINQSSEPAVQTATSGTVTVVPNVADDLRGESWRQQALTNGYQSVISLPLEYEDVRYGVLSVYADQQTAFDELVGDVLEELGDTVAHAINAIQRKRGSMSDEVTEVKLVVHDPDCVLHRVARNANAAVEFDAIIPQSGDTTRVLFTVTSDSVAEIRSFADESVVIESINHVHKSGDEHLFEATTTGSIVVQPLIDFGAVPQKITADQSVVHLEIELPQFANVREIVNLLENRFGKTELLRRRDRQRSGQSTREFIITLEDQMTERQYEVLRTAYESGFFEEPRAITGQEVADLIGISQSTFNHHLRAAERKLFMSLFGDQ